MAGDKQVRIVMTSHGRGEVFIDGHKIDGVGSVEFRAKAGGFNVVTLELTRASVEIESAADVEADVTDLASDSHKRVAVP